MQYVIPAGQAVRRHLVAAAALALAVPPASAQDGVAALRARGLAATCAACHGTDGRGAAGSTPEALAGMPATKLSERMKAFKSGALAGTVMPQLAKGYSDAQIEQLADYYATVPPR